MFEEIKTKNPEEAVDILLEDALNATPYITEEQVLSGYVSLQKAWASEILVDGDVPKLRNIILNNLEELAAHSVFETFVIKVLDGQSCAQVMAIYPTTFTGIRVWKTKDRLYACGNSAFRAVPAEIPNLGQKIRKFLKRP